MSKGLKIANSGINALENNDPKNFSIFVDGTTDHVLIKEKQRGTQSVGSYSDETINHNLDYEPLAFSFVEDGGDYQWVYGLSAYNSFYLYITDSLIYMYNGSGSSRDFTYIVFYDQTS